jgi:hypothetical protein
MKALFLIINFSFLLAFVNGQTATVGISVQGDFDGDGQKEYATAAKVKEGKGNPVDGGTADLYFVNFSNAKFKHISSGCCDLRLIMKEI